MYRFITLILLMVLVTLPFTAQAGDDVSLTKNVETTHPYLWHGVGLAGGGALIFIVGIAFNAAADSEYDKYDSMMSEAKMKAAIAAGETKIDYTARADSHLADGKSYAATRTVSYVAGGILALTGGILMLLTEEKSTVPKFAATTDGKGVYANLTLSF
ncbi:MAG TPA: hypothetical protein PLV42_12040 [bacterium]|nr:hypothetical protein [bacterium]